MRTLRALILDTSAFIQGFDTSNPEIQLYTTPLVLGEIRDEMARIRAQNWAQTGKLVVQTPDDTSMKKVSAQAGRMGEAKALSETDLSLLALTHQLTQQGAETTLLSDDYSVQNLADELGLSYTGMITRGIKRRYQWIHYCPGCRRKFEQPQPDNTCPVCGTQLKRKPGKKSRRRGGV